MKPGRGRGGIGTVALPSALALAAVSVMELKPPMRSAAGSLGLAMVVVTI